MWLRELSSAAENEQVIKWVHISNSLKRHDTSIKLNGTRLKLGGD
jgi:hypothetical protein